MTRTSGRLLAWRLVRREHADSAFLGTGAKRYGGRWNQPGTSVVYLAESLALAALEVLVHLGRPYPWLRFLAYPVRFPPSLVEDLDPRDLPASWRSHPPSEETMRIGSEWVASATSVLLRVPSVVVAPEHNYLLSPAHRDFRRVEIGDPIPFSFDPRLSERPIPSGHEPDHGGRN